jgi:hypothetical protein
MSNKFDELTKQMAQSVTRRQALRRFGLGMVGVFAAWVGLGGASAAPAANKGKCVAFPSGIGTGKVTYHYTGVCMDPATCQYGSSPDCPAGAKAGNVTYTCGLDVASRRCSF